MLNKNEAKIMDYIFEKCRGKKSALITPKELLSHLMPKIELTAKQLDAHVKNLALDSYIDVHTSDNKGHPVYVISLKLKGEAYEREKEERRKKLMRGIGWKILLAVLGATVAFIVTNFVFGWF